MIDLTQKLSHLPAQRFDKFNYSHIRGHYRNEKEFPVDMDKIGIWKRESEAFFSLTNRLCQSFSDGPGTYLHQLSVVDTKRLILKQ